MRRECSTHRSALGEAIEVPSRHTAAGFATGFGAVTTGAAAGVCVLITNIYISVCYPSGHPDSDG
jgi:hypothetical protein